MLHLQYKVKHRNLMETRHNCCVIIFLCEQNQQFSNNHKIIGHSPIIIMYTIIITVNSKWKMYICNDVTLPMRTMFIERIIAYQNSKVERLTVVLLLLYLCFICRNSNRRRTFEFCNLSSNCFFSIPFYSSLSILISNLILNNALLLESNISFDLNRKSILKNIKLIYACPMPIAQRCCTQSCGAYFNLHLHGFILISIWYSFILKDNKN